MNKISKQIGIWLTTDAFKAISITVGIAILTIILIIIVSVGKHLFIENHEENIIVEKTVHLKSEEVYSKYFSNLKKNTKIEWKWSIDNPTNNSISFWIEDYKLDKYNYGVSKKTLNFGNFSVKKDGNYYLNWKNENQNRSVNLSLFVYVKKIITDVDLFVKLERKNLEPNEKWCIKFKNIEKETTLEWKWSVIKFNNDTVNFWVEDENGKKYNRISTFQEFRFEKGFFDTNKKGDYSLVWENANQNESVIINVEFLDEALEVGNVYIDCVIYILCGFLIVFFIAFKKKHQIKVFDKKMSFITKVLVIAVIAVFLFLMFCVLIADLEMPPEKKHLQIKPIEQKTILYSDVLDDEYITWYLRLESKEKAKLNFWIEDEDGVKYKYFTLSENLTSNSVGFVTPKECDYFVALENPTNQSVNIFYEFDPGVDLLDILINERGYIPIGGFCFQILFVVLIFLNVYLVIKNRRIKMDIENWKTGKSEETQESSIISMEKNQRGIKDERIKRNKRLYPPIYRKCAVCKTKLIYCEVCGYKYCPVCGHECTGPDLLELF